MRRSLVIRVSPLAAAASNELLRTLMHSEVPELIAFRETILKAHKCGPAPVLLLCEALEGATLDVGDAA